MTPDTQGSRDGRTRNEPPSGERTDSNTRTVLARVARAGAAIAGVAEGNAGRRGLWRGAMALMMLALVAVAATPVRAQTEVPNDWTLKPSGLSAGDQFRLLFATSTTRNASSSSISVYNTFVQGRAAAGHSAIRTYSSGFRVVGCTADDDARDNTSTTYTASDKGVPIYWLNGNKVADDYEDFYDGSWDDEANAKNESGNSRTLATSYPFTGCNHNGTEAVDQSVVSRALGASNVRQGAPNSPTSGYGPLSSGNVSVGNSTTRPFYALSQVFQVATAVDDVVTPPEAVDDLASTGDCGGPNLSWSAVTDASRYRVEWKRSNRSWPTTPSASASRVVTGTSARIGGLAKHVDHDIRVLSGNDDTFALTGNVITVAHRGCFTAGWADAPEMHMGNGRRFSVDLLLSEYVVGKRRAVMRNIVDITGGRIVGARRNGKFRWHSDVALWGENGSGRVRAVTRNWRLTVEPEGADDITLSVTGGLDCDQEGALCGYRGEKLARSASITIPSMVNAYTEEPVCPKGGFPLKVCVLDSVADEGDALEFEIVLSRSVQRNTTPFVPELVRRFEVWVDVEIENGTAVRREPGSATGGDYRWFGKNTFYIGQGKSGRTIRVQTYTDSTDDNGETVKLKLSNARWINFWVNGAGHDADGVPLDPDGKPTARHLGITRAEATGTIYDARGISVADASATEGTDTTIDFTVTLASATTIPVTVDYATVDGTAKDGEDYTAQSGTLTFAVGETSKTVKIAVLSDEMDEEAETFTLVLTNPSTGATITDGSATGTISNTGSIPRAWLARFGRTAAEHVVEGIGERLAASRTVGAEGSLAGYSLGASALAEGVAGTGDAGEQGTLFAHALEPTANAAAMHPQGMTGAELLARSAFAVTGASAGGGSLAVWGRGTRSGFEGDEDGVDIEGDVTTLTLGTDWSGGTWLAGLALAHSRGEGAWRGAVDTGEVEASLTGLYPYAGYRASERLTLWAAGGHGTGELTVETAHKTLRTDISMTMGAAGARGDLLVREGDEGPALALEADALNARTDSDAIAGLGASEAETTRLRLALEASHGLLLERGTLLMPNLELGVRHDSGDAETGFGADIGGGLLFASARSGLRVEISGRTLVTHEDSDFREWGLSGALLFDPQPDSVRGPSLSLRHTLGAASSGGAQALFERRTMAGLASTETEANPTLEVEAGYGFAMLHPRAVLTPYSGLSWSEQGGRTYRAGTRWQLAPEALIALEATRNEANESEATNALTATTQVRW